jgi:hypothetical protein
MIMNKFIKIVILISLFRANLMAGEATGYLDLKKISMMAVATGAGYIGWLFANKQLGKQVKKNANKESLEQEISERVTEITGKNYQLTAKDQDIINSPKLKLVVFRSAKENFTMINHQLPAEAVLKKPSGLLICDHNKNYQLWHNFGPNFNKQTAENVPAYTRTFDQNYNDLIYSSFAEPDMIDLLSSQTAQCPAKQSALAKISGNSAFCKFKKRS